MIATCPQLAVMSLDELAWLVHAEYREMPGTRLTFEQVRRLFGLSSVESRRVLDYLVETGVLIEDESHRFRLHDDAVC